jgi:hypothetical protein
MSAPHSLTVVTPDDDLYRTVIHTFVRDGRVSPAVLMTNNQADPISVHIARLAPPPEQLAKRREKPHLGVAVLPARVPLVELGLAVEHVPERGEVSHAHIHNPGDRARQRENCRRMAEAMRIVVPPTPPSASQAG